MSYSAAILNDGMSPFFLSTYLFPTLHLSPPLVQCHSLNTVLIQVSHKLFHFSSQHNLTPTAVKALCTLQYDYTVIAAVTEREKSGSPWSQWQCLKHEFDAIAKLLNYDLNIQVNLQIPSLFFSPVPKIPRRNINEHTVNCAMLYCCSYHFLHAPCEH